MPTQEHRTDLRPVGACSDCGTPAQPRITCLDEITHSTVELCERCWCVFQQRQVFADGCCG
jgi:hypothetical protein